MYGRPFSMAPFGAPTFILTTSRVDCSPKLTRSLRFVASVLETDPLLVDLHGTAPKRYILPTTLPTLSTGEEDEVKKPTEYTLVAVFDRSGRYIYTGTSRGHFNVIDADTREVCMLISFNVNSSSWSRCLDYALQLSSTSDFPTKVEISVLTAPTALFAQSLSLEIQASAHVEEGIRMMAVMTTSPMMRLLRWSINSKILSIVYSGMLVHSVELATTSWVRLFYRWILIIASTVKAAHDIYVWERAMGSLIKILEGPKEELIDVDVSLSSKVY